MGYDSPFLKTPKRPQTEYFLQCSGDVVLQENNIFKCEVLQIFTILSHIGHKPFIIYSRCVNLEVWEKIAIYNSQFTFYFDV